jgi:hypothetical protein
MRCVVIEQIVVYPQVRGEALNVSNCVCSYRCSVSSTLVFLSISDHSGDVVCMCVRVRARVRTATVLYY